MFLTFPYATVFNFLQHITIDILNDLILQGRLIYRFCPEKRPWDVGGGGGGGGCCLTFLLRWELLIFPSQKLRENIIITPDKFVIDFDYVHPCSPFAKRILGACFGPGPFALDTVD